MIAAGHKDPGALLTIGELSQELGIAQHILRYWETKFPQLRPMQRAGNRRYYRAADIDLARRINRLLNDEGYTVRGVQKLLRDKHGAEAAPAPQSAASHIAPVADAPPPAAEPAPQMPEPEQRPGIDVVRLAALRDRLVHALDS